jgi:hypothetical protein
LLLDTLCNALGGVLFIALLVVLLAHQVPVLEPSDPMPTVSESEILSLEAELRGLPSEAALKEQLQSYEVALAEYAETGLEPVPTESEQEALLRERQRLSILSDAPVRKPASYRVPAIHQTTTVSGAYIVLFREGKIYASPFSVELLASRGARLSDQLKFQYSQQGVIQIVPEGTGLAMNPALRELKQAIQEQVVVPEQFKLFLYVYPDSVELMQGYRKQAMQWMPKAIWYGIEEGANPRLIISDRSQSELMLGF